MPSPSVVPGLAPSPAADDLSSGCAVIDTDHLTRMTFGEEGLRREVLALFERQAILLTPRLRQPHEAAEAAHTLAGAASAIGAMVLAEAATELERTVKHGENSRDAIIAVEHAIVDALAAITGLLG